MQLKSEQEKAIRSFALGHDVFVWLPYRVATANYLLRRAAAPIVFDRIRGGPGFVVLVVFPLTALMKDQVALFKSKGLAAIPFFGEEQR